MAPYAPADDLRVASTEVHNLLLSTNLVHNIIRASHELIAGFPKRAFKESAIVLKEVCARN
jgi:hypothetical protein